MNIFISAPIFCTYLTISSNLEDVEAYSGRSNLQANCLSDFDALFVGLSHHVACTISHSFVFLWFWIQHWVTSHGFVSVQYLIQTISTERCLRRIRNFKNKCLIQNYFNGTILTTDVNLNATFHKPTTVQTCLPHFWIMKILRCRQAISQPFFLHYRDMQYCFGWRRHQQQKNSPHCRSIDSFMFNNSTINLYFCWCALLLFLIPITLYCFGQRGAGLRRRSRYVTRLCVRPIFISKESNLLSHFNWLIVGVFYEMFFHCNFCLFLWWIISKCGWWERTMQ